MILYYYGDNDYAIAHQLRTLKTQYEKKYADALEYVVLDGSQIKLADLETAFLSQPMFFSHRLVIVRELAGLKDIADKLEELMEKVPESTVAVFDGRGIDKRLALHKNLLKLARAQEYPRLNDTKLMQWVQREAKKQGAEIAPADAQYLIRKAGSDQWRLSNEVHKLASVEGGTITHEWIDELVVGDWQETVFDFIDLLHRADVGKALTAYDRLIESGGNEQQLIATLQWHYRTLLLVSKNADPDQLAVCGVKPYAASRAREVAKGYSTADLARVYEALLVTDVAMKAGTKKPHQAMTDLVLVLSEEL